MSESEPKDFPLAALQATWPAGYRVLDLTPPKLAQEPRERSALEAYVELAFIIDRPGDLAEAPLEVLRAAVSEIVVFEGPVHEHEVARRLSFMWKLNRTGPRVIAAAMRGLATAEASGLLVHYGPFWEKAGGSELRLRIRTTAQGRRAEYLPPREIVAGAAQVQAMEGPLPAEQLVSRVAFYLGFSKPNLEVVQAIRQALDRSVPCDNCAAAENRAAATSPTYAPEPVSAPTNPLLDQTAMTLTPKPNGKLRPCSDCGNPVSLKAFACPHCGNPQPASMQAIRATRVRATPRQRKTSVLKIIGSALKSWEVFIKRISRGR